MSLAEAPSIRFLTTQVYPVERSSIQGLFKNRMACLEENAEFNCAMLINRAFSLERNCYERYLAQGVDPSRAKNQQIFMRAFLKQQSNVISIPSSQVPSPQHLALLLVLICLYPLQ